MPTLPETSARVAVEGKFFRLGEQKFFVKGLTYGPFAPGPEGDWFPARERVENDLQQIRAVGANLLRVYHVPPTRFLDLAAEQDLRVLVDIPWPKHLCFLDSPTLRAEALKAVRSACRACGKHPAIFAYSVANEIPSDIVRWSGARRVELFIDKLVSEVKSLAPDALCTFTNYPPTEFLRPETVDFASYNVYLHDREQFERYLERLQMLADTRPLLLAELGMDSLREGEPRKCAYLAEQIETAFRGGAAGTIVFSYTDDWFRGGREINDWGFGITDRQRRPKSSFETVRKAYHAAPHFALPSSPKVSVIVASYNGGRTLETCLNSLRRLNYPDYEVILVDDGSTDDTPAIAARFNEIRTIRQSNQGLSAARNAGLAAATGKIVAFTDSDCRADEDWLKYLVGDLLSGPFAGIGGPNLLPPEDSPVAAAVMVSPGGPAHVMLTDTEAEHIPGCNMAFWKSALDEIGGFDPVFHAAGDDVDVCWRLRQAGRKIGFSSAAVVWHYRRSTIKAYLKQQNGYGEAEAILLRKHPEYFDAAGRSKWAGRIYSASKGGPIVERSVIYRGIFGSGFFQKLYAPGPSHGLLFHTSLEFHLLVSVPSLVAALIFPWFWPVTIAALLLSVTACTIAAFQAPIPSKKCRFWSRPLVGFLFFVQPIERGLARYRAQFDFSPTANNWAQNLKPAARNQRLGADGLLSYWSEGDVDRLAFLQAILTRLECLGSHPRADRGWSDHDLEILPSAWSRLQVTTVAETLDGGRLNLRCRLQTSWSVRAKVLFWAAVAVELIIGSVTGPAQPWIWLILLSVPLLSWFIERKQRALCRSLASLVDRVAENLGLIRLVENQAPSAKERGLPLPARDAALLTPTGALPKEPRLSRLPSSPPRTAQ